MKEQIAHDIENIIYEVTGVNVTNYDDNLMGSHLNINISDFLYIFNLMADKWDEKIYLMLRKIDYRKMTINALENEIMKF